MSQAEVHVVSITPFDADGAFNEDALRRHLRRLAAAGVSVHIGGSGSGEGNALTLDETRLLYRIAVEELKGKVPVRAMGVEPRTADQLIELIVMAEAAGLDAMQIYSLDMGHGVKPSERELERYYLDVLSTTTIPVILSSHHYAGYLLPVSLIKRLAKQFDNIVGIIATTNDFAYLINLVKEFSPTLQIDTTVSNALNVLAAGGHGIGISEANLAPNLCASAIASYNDGDFTSAHSYFTKIFELNTALGKYGSIRGIKAALNILGLPGGYPRRPRLPLDAQEQGEISALLDALDIRGLEGL